MSYILDALKKSEQERGHGNIPDVQTVHSSSLNYRNDKNAYWPYILIAAVMLNLLAIIYFITSKEKPAETTATINKELVTVATETGKAVHAEETEAPTTSATTATVSTIKQPEIAEPVADTAPPANNISPVTVDPVTVAVDKNSQATDKTIPEKTVSGNNRAIKHSASNVIDFHELPESIKQQLPAIVISAHVYSSNPQQRSIVVNNNFLEQGEYVLDDLILHEITSDGAIFDYQGTLFNYGVVSGWQ